MTAARVDMVSNVGIRIFRMGGWAGVVSGKHRNAWTLKASRLLAGKLLGRIGGDAEIFLKTAPNQDPRAHNCFQQAS